MERRIDDIYVYTMVHDEKGIKSSDICYEFEYDQENKKVKTLFDDEEILFEVLGDIELGDKSVKFDTIDKKSINLNYLTLPVYDSLKGYLLNYNYPCFNSDREVQDYFKKKKKLRG